MQAFLKLWDKLWMLKSEAVLSDFYTSDVYEPRSGCSRARVLGVSVFSPSHVGLCVDIDMHAQFLCHYKFTLHLQISFTQVPIKHFICSSAPYFRFILNVTVCYTCCFVQLVLFWKRNIVRWNMYVFGWNWVWFPALTCGYDAKSQLIKKRPHAGKDWG